MVAMVEKYAHYTEEEHANHATMTDTVKLTSEKTAAATTA